MSTHENIWKHTNESDVIPFFFFLFFSFFLLPFPVNMLQPEIHHIEKLKYPGTNSKLTKICISICTARYRGVWVSRVDGFRGCSIVSGNCHIFNGYSRSQVVGLFSNETFGFGKRPLSISSWWISGVGISSATGCSTYEWAISHLTHSYVFRYVHMCWELVEFGGVAFWVILTDIHILKHPKK